MSREDDRHATTRYTETMTMINTKKTKQKPKRNAPAEEKREQGQDRDRAVWPRKGRVVNMGQQSQP